MARMNDRKMGTDHSFAQLCPIGPFQIAPPQIAEDQESSAVGITRYEFQRGSFAPPAHEAVAQGQYLVRWKMISSQTDLQTFERAYLDN